MLSDCTYCSTPLDPTLEDQTIMSCSFCGKVLSAEEEWQTIRLKRKLRGDGRRKNRGHQQRLQEAECEQSCVTATYCLEDDKDLSDSDSTASSKFYHNRFALSEVDAADEADITVSRKSNKRK